MQLGAFGIQRREKAQLWALEKASRQRRFSNWVLDDKLFEWGGNAFEVV